MSLRLETQGLTKRFGTFSAVADVSLSFAPGLVHAVLGENGAGKSTLMKLLFGLHTPTSGKILINGCDVQFRNSMDAISAGLGMVQQHFSLVETLSVIDNIMLGAEVCLAGGRLDRATAIAQIESLLPSASLSVPWNQPVQELNVGQKQRVEILKLLFRKSQILFLDEPTAVLAPREIIDFFEVLRELKRQGRTIVLITHKINEVLQVCDTYTVLRQGKLVAKGLVSETSIEKIVESMIGHRLAEFSVDRTPASAAKVFDCDDLREASLERGRLDGVSIKVHAGEIVGVAGVEGSGQSHLVDAVMGLRHFTGTLSVLGKSIEPLQTAQVRALGTALIPEDRHHQGLWLEESCYINMVIGLEDRFLDRDLFDFKRMRFETEKWAKEFDVRAPSLESPVGTLSGGNQQKIIFAREVTGREPKLLVCHQPTRGVDLGAIDLIHRRLLKLRNEGVGVLVLSSELDELLQLCDRLYVFFEGRVVAEFKRSDFDRMAIGAAMTGATTLVSMAASDGDKRVH